MSAHPGPLQLERDLNEEQLAAVTAPDGPVLVIAAAGTGKTRTLTYRVAYLVERGIDPSNILLLTFTNRAAREMLERAEALVGERVGGLWGGTFHHMANRILRRHAEALEYRHDYTILDQDDSRSLIRSCADELDLLGKHFPKPEVLGAVFSLAANRNGDIEEAAEAHFRDNPVDLVDLKRVHDAYRERKRALNAMDFDDLLVNALTLFRKREDILDRYRERFRHVLVDEYQDTNPIQAEWVDGMAGLHRNLLVVGDDFQSIYSWRGADFRNILSFPERYPDATVFKLETNYRSVPGILRVANACIAGNPEQFQKQLHPVRTATERPVWVRCRDGGLQAAYVSDGIRARLREGEALEDMAVLYRSHFQAMELQLELTRAGVPYILTSGVRFFEQAHIKDACSLLKLYAHPGDELAFERLIQLLPKVGKKTSAKLWRSFGGRVNLRDAGQRAKLAERLPAGARASWKPIAAALDEADPSGIAQHPGELIHRFLEVFYRAYAVETFENYDRRLEDIEELIDYSGKFRDTEDFLSEMALMSNLDAEASGAESETGVKLSTIHQAKGLEWKIVWVLWLADGMFPSGRSLAEPEGEAEERRLFYVAVTRAKDRLFLCTPAMRFGRDGDVIRYAPSRFIREIDPALMDAVMF